jgi:hypothetical protein
MLPVQHNAGGSNRWDGPTLTNEREAGEKRCHWWIGDVSPSEVASVIKGGEFVAMEARRVDGGYPVDDNGRGSDIDEQSGLAAPERAPAIGGAGDSTGGHAETRHHNGSRVLKSGGWGKTVFRAHQVEPGTLADSHVNRVCRAGGHCQNRQGPRHRNYQLPVFLLLVAASRSSRSSGSEACFVIENLDRVRAALLGGHKGGVTVNEISYDSVFGEIIDEPSRFGRICLVARGAS